MAKNINTKDKLSIFLIILMLLLKMGFFKVFGMFFVNDVFMNVIYLMLIFIITFLVWIPRNKTICLEVFLCVVSLLISIFHGMIEGNGLSPGPVLSKSLNYLFVILALPIFKLLKQGKWRFRKCIELLVTTNVFSYLLRWFISEWYSITGKIVFESIAFESATNFFRSGTLRINPPCITLIFVPLCYYLIITEKKFKKRVAWVCSIIIHFVFVLNVYMARSVLVYSTLSLLIMYAIQKVSSWKSLIRWIIITSFIVIILNSSYFDSFVNSFSTESSLALSTTSRIQSFTYALTTIKNHPVLGTGLVNYNSIYGYGSLSDVGFLMSISQIGLPIVMFYTFIFYIGFKSALMLKKVDPSLAVLEFGMTASIIMTGFTIDCFFNIFSFAVPFYIAISNYLLIVAQKPNSKGK